MTLSPGATLGPYRIVAQIGAGGMGEVYRGEDTRLGRTVAIKVLPSGLAQNPQFQERLEREARAVSSLNHPHICTLYDIGRQDGTSFPVMEYLEGETLAARLEKGTLRVDQALRYGVEIAEALDAAHRKGIFHRDLKPGNIFLTKSGIKLLDFGLAKIQSTSNAASSESALTKTITQQGTILGTPQYMAPEQLQGEEADARADVFAFGAVLYEMLTGRRAFEGKTAASVMAAILHLDPPSVSTLQPVTPPAVERIVRKCLAKDPDQRWQTVADLGDELRWVANHGAMAAPAASTSIPSRPGWLRWLWPAISAALALSLTGLAFVYFREQPAGPVRFQISAPEKTTILPFLTISPDGRQIAFLARDSANTITVWLHPLGTGESRPLTPVDGRPFWSPDSRFLAFPSAGKLKKIDLSGDPPETICDLTGPWESGAWGREDVILFADLSGRRILRVPAAGGIPTPVTSADPSHPQTLHVAPVFLPDGRHFLCLQAPSSRKNTTLYAASVDAKPAEQSTKPILRTSWDALYVPSPKHRTGYLLFMRDRTLLAQAFDPGSFELVGPPMTVADQIDDNTSGRGGWAAFWASTNGVLAFKPSDIAAGSRIAWYDRQGNVVGTLGEAGTYQDLSLSPDGSRAAIHRSDGENDLWLFDVRRKVAERFTFDPQRDEAAVWSPDGARIAFGSERRGPFNLYLKSASGTGEIEPLLPSGEVDVPNDWSPDGRLLLYSEIDKSRHSGMWLLPLYGTRKPMPFLTTAFNESHGRFSPDGHWIVYTSDESGKSEVYVRPFPTANGGGKWLISSGGGYQPLWRRDGKELLYFSPDSKLMSVDVRTGSSFQAGAPKVLFAAPMADGPADSNFHRWDIAPDGQHFLINVALNAGKSQPITVVLNWTAALNKK